MLLLLRQFREKGGCEKRGLMRVGTGSCLGEGVSGCGGERA